jgi:hypothetical protein
MVPMAKRSRSISEDERSNLSYSLFLDAGIAMLGERATWVSGDGMSEFENAVRFVLRWGLRWTWHSIKRYRLAIGFAGLTVGFGIIRFISLHEIDAWNANAPWVRTAVDLVAAAVVSAVAIARLYQLRTFSRTSTPVTTRPKLGRPWF